MPTTRQYIAATKLSEIIRKSKGQKRITIGKILKEAGYSTSTSESPTVVTETKGFKELLDKYLPESLVTKSHADLLDAGKLDSYTVDGKMTDKEIEKLVESVGGCKVRRINRYRGRTEAVVYFWSPDGQTRRAAIDMAYKLRGNYAAEKHDVSHSLETIIIKDYGDGNGKNN